MAKIILDLCGGTGAWSKPYREAGYDVRLITLPDYDVTQTVVDTVIPAIVFHGSAETMRVPAGEIHGILAAPPCTMFSRARSNSKAKPRDLATAMVVVQACMEIIWAVRATNSKGKEAGGLKFWALENPMGLLRQFLGNPPHSFRGWEWGDDHLKFTDLWGYYGMPKAKYKHQPLLFNREAWANPKKPPEYAHLKLTAADIRAITPPLFAKAFMEENR